MVKLSLVESKISRTYIIYSSAIGLGTLMMVWLVNLFERNRNKWKSYGIIWALLNIMVGIVAFAHKIETQISKLKPFIVGILCVLGYIFIANNMNYVA